MTEDSGIINFYEVLPERFRSQYPNPHRSEIADISIPAMIAVVGGTGSGKSMFVLNFLERARHFETFPGGIHICLKTQAEPLYEGLAEALPDIQFHEIRQQKERGKMVTSGLPDLDHDFDKAKASLIIFDDLVGERDQSQFEQYYLRSRKRGVTCIYLSQSFYRMPRFIRLQLHYLVILKLNSSRDIAGILDEYTVGMNRTELLAIYRYATRERFHFMMIDVAAPVERKFRINFDTIVDLDS